MSLFKKLPSFNMLYQNAISTLIRFPFTILSAVITAGVLVTLAESVSEKNKKTLGKIALSSALGIPLFTALTIFAEKQEWDNIKRILTQTFGFVPILIFYATIFNAPEFLASIIVKFTLLFIAFHLMVAFLPYLIQKGNGNFWEYNKSLFVRFLTTALFSAVLYIGLVIAMLAIDELFGVDIEEERYFQLWIIGALILNTWVFLGGIPKDVKDLGEVRQYPIVLKFFAQYILLPLMSLYFIILYAYEIKIIATWNWPRGWVSQLVLWYSIVGIFSLLLLWPLRELSENQWIKVFTNWFFRALIPLIIMLFFAILERVGDYGITVNRYLVLSMAVGLSLVTLYFAFSRKKDIRLIPIIVCVVALLSACGPWGAFSVSERSQSERSQRGRLEKSLIKNEILIDNKIRFTDGDISFDERKEISSLVSYLSEWHGVESFSPWFPDSVITELMALEYKYNLADSITQRMGFKYIRKREDQDSDDGFFNTQREIGTVNDISGYTDYIFYDSHKTKTKDLKTTYLLDDNDVVSIWLDTESACLKVGFRQGPDAEETVYDFCFTRQIILIPLRFDDGNISGDQFTYEKTIGEYNAKVIVESISGDINQDIAELFSLSAHLLLRKNN